MNNVQWGSLLFASMLGSLSILVSMYLVMPALGLPRLDFAAVTSGWVGATGRYAKMIGVAVFVLGGIGWGFLWVKIGGMQSLTANLVQHLIFGLCLGQFYK